MKKSIVAVVLVCAMVLAFSAVALADHSPLYYFNFQAGNGVTQGENFLEVFPASWNTSASALIDNGVWFGPGTPATPHSGYSQSTAKCEVCHAVHRAPTGGTSALASKGNTQTVVYSTTPTQSITLPNGRDVAQTDPASWLAAGTATVSSRYESDAWTSEASTQMLLRSSTARACLYCHVAEAPSGKMFGGDMSLGVVGDTAYGWGAFYGHTTGCTGCHAVHGANTFKSADGTVDKLILKYSGVKNLGTIPMDVQKQVYGGTTSAGTALYTSQANMIAGTLTTAAATGGATPLTAAVTAQCTICHRQYAVGEETINSDYLMPELFQQASWATANGQLNKIFIGNAANPVSVLPGMAGFTYTGGTPSAITGGPSSVILAFKNHPLKAGGQPFKGSGASAFFTSGNVPVSATGSTVCQSCHNAPDVTDGAYLISSFPHYTPGYYKFMLAQNQGAFNTPTTLAQFVGGRQAFYSNGGKPAIMNDGYCTKCHNTVGTTY